MADATLYVVLKARDLTTGAFKKVATEARSAASSIGGAFKGIGNLRTVLTGGGAVAAFRIWSQMADQAVEARAKVAEMTGTVDEGVESWRVYKSGLEDVRVALGNILVGVATTGAKLGSGMFDLVAPGAARIEEGFGKTYLDRLKGEQKDLENSIASMSEALAANPNQGAGLLTGIGSETFRGRIKEAADELTDVNAKINAQETAETEAYFGTVIAENTKRLDAEAEAMRRVAGAEEYRLSLVGGAGGPSPESMADAQDAMAERQADEASRLAAIDATTARLREQRAVVQEIAGSVSGGIGGALRQLAEGEAPKVRDVLRGILADIIATRAQAAIMKGLLGLGFAEGGVAQGGFTPIRAFADGGVVTRPTIGIVGEGGQDEAIVPLRGGAIPVQGSTGGITVNITVTSLDPSTAAGVILKNMGAIKAGVMQAMQSDADFRGSMKARLA